MRFVQHCEGATPALHGKFSYRVPQGDVTPPGSASNLTITRQSGNAVVSWSNPTDPDYAFALVRYLFGTTPPQNPDGSLSAYAGKGTTVTIRGVGSSPVAVAVYSVDKSGNVGIAATSVSP